MNIDEHSSIEECSDLISNGWMTSIEKHLPKGRALKKLRLGEYGLSPLHLAAWHNRPDLCEYLIKKGIDPDIKEKYSGKTPLHIASYLGKMEAVLVLWRNGAEALCSKISVDFLF